MKSLLAVLALLAVAPIAHAQNADTQSDSYVCYHGGADDPRTNAACDRVQAAANQPVTPVAAAPKSGLNQAQNTTALAVKPNASPPTKAKDQTAAAQPAATDVGEAPLNAKSNADEANGDDNGGTDVSIHGSWLAGLGALAVIAIAVGCFAGLAIYFIPTIIAIARRKRNTLGIFILNLLLGWSFIGWVAALVWSLMTDAP